MTLTQLGIGETATIVAIEDGRNLRQKLLLRGLFEGMSDLSEVERKACTLVFL